MGQVSHFLGLKFQWKQYNDNNKERQLKLHLSQKAFLDQLIQSADLISANKFSAIPYRSGFSVDAVPDTPTNDQPTMSTYLRHLVGSFLWLSQGTRPDLSTVTSMIAQYQNAPSKGHIDAARYAIRYAKQHSAHGIVFDSKLTPLIKAYNQFPTDPLYALTDANWGAQDQSTFSTQKELDLFKSRSMSGHIIHLHGPLHWQSKRQTITARSSAEAEIYATDECVRELIYIRKILKDLKLTKTFMKLPIPILNDNMACVQWTRNKTTRTIRHIQLQDNGVRENVQKKIITVEHIPGKENIADIFTKEDRDKSHFQSLRDKIVLPPFKCHNTIYSIFKYFFPTHSEVHIVTSDATGGVRIPTNVPYKDERSEYLFILESTRISRGREGAPQLEV